MDRMKLLMAVLAFWICSMAAGAEAQPAGDGGVSLENQSLRVTAAAGQPGVVLHFKAGGIAQQVEIAIQASGAATAPPSARPRSWRMRPASACSTLRRAPPRRKSASARACSSRSSRARTRPASRSAGARYVALPDFFADDVLFDPLKFTAATLSVPAENFLLQFLEGGDAMLMCIWPGNLKLPVARGAAAAAGQGREGRPRPAGRSALCRRGPGPPRGRDADRVPEQAGVRGRPCAQGHLARPGGRRPAGLSAHDHRLEAALRGQVAG